MATGQDSEPFFSRDELMEFQRKLSLLSDAGVQQEYQRCWHDAHYDGKRLPAAVTIQQLVASWRVLRMFQKRRR